MFAAGARNNQALSCLINPDAIPDRPGTKGRREALEKLIGYLEPRLAMMRYQEWIEQDLVIASGQVEGAVRHLVGERLDCSGMRWTQGKAEPLLHLRCLELNGDWERFYAWAHQRHHERLRKRQRVKSSRTNPSPCRRQHEQPVLEMQLHPNELQGQLADCLSGRCRLDVIPRPR